MPFRSGSAKFKVHSSPQFLTVPQRKKYLRSMNSDLDVFDTMESTVALCGGDE